MSLVFWFCVWNSWSCLYCSSPYQAEPGIQDSQRWWNTTYSLYELESICSPGCNIIDLPVPFFISNPCFLDQCLFSLNHSASLVCHSTIKNILLSPRKHQIYKRYPPKQHIPTICTFGHHLWIKSIKVSCCVRHPYQSTPQPPPTLLFWPVWASHGLKSFRLSLSDTMAATHISTHFPQTIHSVYQSPMQNTCLPAPLLESTLPFSIQTIRFCLIRPARNFPKSQMCPSAEHCDILHLPFLHLPICRFSISSIPQSCNPFSFDTFRSIGNLCRSDSVLVVLNPKSKNVSFRGKILTFGNFLVQPLD